MKNTEVKYFSSEEEYTRFIIGRFKDERYVPSMLKEYGELCGDSPKISKYYNAFFEVDPEILDGIDMIPGSCKEFLACMGADKLIEHFKL